MASSKEYFREYYIKNRDKILARENAKYAKDPEYRKNVKERVKKWKEENFEREKLNDRMWYLNNKERILSRRVERKYGLAPEDYKKLFKDQKGACAICGSTCSERKNGNPVALAVDHDHVTNRVRGLLCHHCNTGIGNLKDSPELLEKAAVYLRAHKV